MQKHTHSCSTTFPYPQLQQSGSMATTGVTPLERRTWRGADRITHVRLTFPGDAYDLVARFAPQPAER